MAANAAITGIYPFLGQTGSQSNPAPIIQFTRQIKRPLQANTKPSGMKRQRTSPTNPFLGKTGSQSNPDPIIEFTRQITRPLRTHPKPSGMKRQRTSKIQNSISTLPKDLNAAPRFLISLTSYKAHIDIKNLTNGLIIFVSIGNELRLVTKSLKVNRVILLYAIFLSLIITGCVHDSYEPKLQPCPTFVDSIQCDFGYNYLSDSPKLEKGCFDPMNGSVIYFRSGSSVWKKNLDEGTLEEILKDVQPISQLDMTSEGWLCFLGIDLQIWRARVDGNELEMISNGPRDFGPEFIPGTTNIMYGKSMEYSFNYLQNNPDKRLDYKIFLCDVNGVALDSFCRVQGEDPCNPWEYSSSSKESDLIAAEGNGIGLYDSQGNRVQHFFTAAMELGVYDIEWFPDGQKLAYVSQAGLFEIDLVSGVQNMLLEACQTKRFENISISSTGQKILINSVYSEQQGCDIIQSYGLEIFHLADSSETFLKIFD